MTNQTNAKDREIVFSREFDAPRERVFEAWSKPDNIGQWWGPAGFTTTTHKMAFEPGGEWIFIMHSPDGTDYDNYIRFREIIKPEKITYDHGERSGDPFQFTVTITFEKLGKRTRLTHRLEFPSKDARDKSVEFGAIEGGKQTLSRLAEFLKKSKVLE